MDDRQPGRGSAVHADLPASTRAPRQARLTVRNVLQAWGLHTISDDAELITSELVANAAEHADGSPIGLTIRQHTEPTGQRGILCQVTDASPTIPEAGPMQVDSERGRGLHLVSALATNSGFCASPEGKTAWFTLTAPREPTRARQAGLEAEA